MSDTWADTPAPVAPPADDNVLVTVTGDVIMWMEPDPAAARRHRHRSEVRGWMGPIPRKKAEEFVATGSVWSPDIDPPEPVDEEVEANYEGMTGTAVRSMTVEAVIAWLNQLPAAQRTEGASFAQQAELEKPKPRSTLVEFLDEVLATAGP